MSVYVYRQAYTYVYIYISIYIYIYREREREKEREEERKRERTTHEHVHASVVCESPNVRFASPASGSGPMPGFGTPTQLSAAERHQCGQWQCPLRSSEQVLALLFPLLEVVRRANHLFLLLLEVLHVLSGEGLTMYDFDFF